MKPEPQTIRGLALAIFLVAPSLPTMAQEARPASRVLFTNVNVFDGEHEQLMENANVLVEGSLIKQISTHDISADGATVIDGNPLENLDLVADANKNFVVIMKDGKIYKNALR